MTAIVHASSEAIFLRLVAHAEVLEEVCALAGAQRLSSAIHARDLTRLIKLSASRLPQVLAALEAARDASVMNKLSNGLWSMCVSTSQAEELALMLRGARLYRERIHTDRDEVQVVISKPAEPSQLVAALERTLEGTWDLTTTTEMLGEMAHRAEKRFSIMSPFVDDDGANRIVELFAATRTGIQRELIVREGLPAALKARRDDLRQLGIKVFDFRLPRVAKAETETFHAKVVRVDTNECYVGSSNMNRWSFGYSLELGFHVTGAAGQQISRVIDAVLHVSPPVVI